MTPEAGRSEASFNGAKIHREFSVMMRAEEWSGSSKEEGKVTDREEVVNGVIVIDGATVVERVRTAL